MARRKPTIPPELLDQLLDGSDPKTVFESDGLVDELKRALAERMLQPLQNTIPSSLKPMWWPSSWMSVSSISATMSLRVSNDRRIGPL